MAFSCRFFCQTRKSHTVIEYLKDRRVVEVEVTQHDHGVKPEVGDLIYQCFCVTAISCILGGKNDFGSLFTHFF